MLRLTPAIAVLLLAGPVAAGLLGVVLPSFGWLPALGGSGLTLDHWRALFSVPGLGTSVAISFASGLGAAAAALAVGFLFLAGFSETRVFAWMRRLVSPLLSVPHAAAAFGLAFLIAPSGLIARALSPWATGWARPPDLLIVGDPWGLSMMAGLVMKEVPFLLLMALAALPQIGAGDRMRIARSLGYGGVTAWFKTVAPGLYPLVRLPVFAVIAYSSANVDVAMILGPATPPPLAVAVVRWLNDPELSMRFLASAGAVLQLAVTAAALLAWVAGEAVAKRLAGGWLVDGGRGDLDGLWRGLGGGLIGLTVLTAVLGLAALAVNSLAGPWRFPAALPARFTLDHWREALPAAAEPLATTLLVAVATTVLSLALVLCLLEHETRSGVRPSRRMLAVLYLPLIVPQVAFLFGLVLLAEMAGLRPGLLAVVAGHAVFVLPYIYLSLAEAYRRHDPAWTMVARTLGAGPDGVFWRVRLPMLLAPCLTALAVGAAVSIGQYLATQLLGAGRVPTVTTEAVALASGGERRLIGVLALVQAILPALFFVVAIFLPRLVWRGRRQMRDSY